ncbi:hypothetical protein [Halovivax cerinus]|uniref:Glycosyltransferase RgtA/B/C/D-like domain-containing protein n=1 Tax=Halovivax cerinus TaxID=1487865 RepID=A0ABD5NQR7_9EURY|nr:hypothetical protein [Halovivax cerinus]
MSESYGTRTERVALLVCVTASAIAIVSAYRNPARGYELSMYRATPTLFWGFVVGSVLLSVPIAFRSKSTLNSGLAATNVGWTVLVVGALPVIRGYRYLGTSDALSHLGMARSIVTGSTSVTEILYPLLSLLSSVVALPAGLPLEAAMLLLLPVCTAAYILFVTLIVRDRSASNPATVIACVTACLLLPVNQVSRAGTFYQPYPTLLAIFLTPIVLYLLFRSVTSDRAGFVLGSVVGLVVLVLAHPQQAFNFVLIGITIPLVFHISASGTGPAMRPGRVVSATAITGLIFWRWVYGFDPFKRSVSGLVRSIVQFSGSTGDVSGAGSSLAQLGGSIEELFVKLFLVSAVFCAIGGLYGVVLLLPGRVLPDALERVSARSSDLERGLTVSLIPLFLLFGFYIAFSSQYFRHLGFIMMVISILAPLGMGQLCEQFPTRRRAISTVLSVAFIVFLLLSIPIVHLSPYIYQPTSHVSDAEQAGYASPLDRVQDGSYIHYLRTDPERYYDAYVEWQEPIPFTTRQVLYDGNSLPVGDPTGDYTVLTRSDYEREVGLYDELHVTEADLDGMDSSPTVSRFYTNGNVEWYVHGTA